MISLLGVSSHRSVMAHALTYADVIRFVQHWCVDGRFFTDFPEIERTQKKTCITQQRSNDPEHDERNTSVPDINTSVPDIREGQLS